MISEPYLDLGTGSRFGAMVDATGAFSAVPRLAGPGILGGSGLPGTNSISIMGGPGASQPNNSTIDVGVGSSLVLGGAAAASNIVNNGTVLINGGSLGVATVDPSSSGVFQLTAYSALEIGAILGSSASIQFLDSSSTLIIDSAANFGTNVGSASYAGPLLKGFTSGDVIDIKGIIDPALTYSPVSGDLQIIGSGGAVATLHFQDLSLGPGNFRVTADGSGGSLITHGV